MMDLNEADVAHWLARRNIQMDANRRLRFRASEVSYVRVTPTRDFTRVAFLSYLLLLLTVPTEDDFAGALLWQRAFSLGESPLHRMAESLWRSMGPNASDSSPSSGRLFDRGECVAAANNALVAFGFDWDSYVVPSAGDYIAYKHHDEFVDVASPFDHVARRIMKTLDESGWSPALRITQA